MRTPLTALPNKNAKPVEALRNTTLRDFSGGWNVIDNDLNLSSKYSKRMRNVVRGTDGSINVRPGVRLFKVIEQLDTIVNTEYYANAIISVDNRGVVTATDGSGTTIVVWDNVIAASLPGAPNGWGSTEFVSFSQFRGDLIVCNGVDKPLIINRLLQCEYLYDLGTGTNINTPICRYVVANNRYLVMAGDPIDPSLVHISNIDTSGTWFGDTAPNDAVQIDVGPYVPQGSSFIKGLASFSDRLIVMFEEVAVVFRLGNYVSNAHVPQHEDTVFQNGAISHRTIQSLGNDVLFCDIVGVPSFKRALFTDEIRPSRVSELIDPEIQRRLDGLSTATLEDRVFSVYHRRDGQYMLFVPNENRAEDTTETVCFVYMTIDALKIRAWHEYRGWNWRSACLSAQGRVFFSKENKLFVLGDAQDAVTADFVGEQEPFSDGTTFTDGTGLAVTAGAEHETGVPIKFDWELPWSDFEQRTRIKFLRYMQADTKGTASFFFDMFVDNILQGNGMGEPFSDGTTFSDGYGFADEDIAYAPALSLEMTGGDSAGYGLQPFGNMNYGGGRRSADERLYAFPLKGKIFKPRIRGSTMRPLKIITISFDYLLGSIRR